MSDDEFWHNWDYLNFDELLIIYCNAEGKKN